jgi:hypothetical protein
MNKTAPSLSPEFNKLLTKYVEDFIVRVTSGNTSQVVGATYLLLHGDGDKAVPGLFRILHPQDGPVVHSKTSLQAMGYPSSPTQETYLVFEVAPADDYAGVAWDYAALPNKPAAAALGHPFAVTLQDLLLVSMRTPS